MASLRSGKVKANDGGFIGIREAERNLGNPASSGYILSSNTSGVRSWIDPNTIGSGGGSTGIIVEEEGSPIATGATLINFVGSDVTAVASGTAVTVTFTPSSGGGGGSSIASTITVSDESTDTENFIVFVNGATGNQEPKTGTNLTFNSSTGIITASGFSTSGGTSSQFLKADGSVDSSTYLTSYTETNDLSSAVTWADVPDTNITESSVTQHESALTITESQISDLQSYLTSYTETQTLDDVLGLGNTSSTGLSVGVVTATSFVKSGGGSGFLKADGTEDTSTYLTSFTETNDLSSAVTWADVPDTNITESSVTQHESALTITESQISDLGSYLTAETQTLDNVVGLGSTTTQTINVGSLKVSNYIYDGNGSAGTADYVLTSNGPSTPWSWTAVSDVSGGLLDAIVVRQDGSNVGSGGTNTTLDFYTNFAVTQPSAGIASVSLKDTLTIGALTATGIVTAAGFSTSGGTSSQFLKADGSIDSSTYLTSYTETNDLSSAVTWADVPDTNITESSVTQHESALTITESQISDLGSYLTSYTETQTLNDVLSLGNSSSTGLSVGVVTATSLKGFDHLQAPHGSTVNYSVTVASKTAAHRYNGTGSGSGYVIDGVQSPFLTLTPGRTYRFTLSSGDMSSHPFRFYLRADRSGGTYTTNVTSTSTYTEIVVTDETPTVLHYQCSSHAYMGNAVQVNSNKVNTPYLIVGLNGANVTGVVTATGFSTSGGTSTQFLKADGSVDGSTYLTTYTETNDLSSAVTWANVPDTNITESSVTQHESALTITESQISDLGSYLTSYTETQTLDNVVGLGSTTTQTISVGNLNVTGTGNTSTITGAANLVLDPSAIGDATGKVTILGDLQVDGTQTIINSTTLEVDDKLVSIAKSATNATQANGAGLEINGASATFTYASTGDKWVANKSIEATSFIKSSNSGGFLLADGTEDTNTYLTPTGDGSGLTGVGLDYFEEAQSTSSPNNTVPVNSLSVTGTDSHIDVALVPKGAGAILGNIPDGSSTSGNKRGTYAVDLQLRRLSGSAVASGDYSALIGGYHNTSSGNYSFIGGGYANTVSGAYSAAFGSSVTVSSDTSYAFGLHSLADSRSSFVLGGEYASTRTIQGLVVIPASANPHGTDHNSRALCQKSILNVYEQTTDATPTVLRSNSANSASTTNQLTLKNNSAIAFKATCVAGVTGAGNTKVWELRGALKRGANAASTTLVGSVIKDVIAYDSGAAAWDLDITADTTNGAIKVEVTGQASTTIRWVCTIEATEMSF